MSDFSVHLASGTIDGVNDEFGTPTDYDSGSLRAIVNGAIYDPSDEQYGLTELTGNTFRLNTPPKAGFILQVSYREIPVVGSPYDPDGVLP
jgi:hypothetical protein